MFDLFDRYFADPDRSQFESDLYDKDHVIVLRAGGKIVGFSTLQVSRETFDGRPIVLLFSGDTIMDSEYWSTTALQRNFIRYALDLMHRNLEPLYWLLICSGYRTYRYLPLFFREFWPRYDKSTPPDVDLLMREIATRRFGNKLENGIVVDCNGRLRHHVSPVNDRLTENPHVSFFTSTNPRHHLGHELVCLARISGDNLTRAVTRIDSRADINASRMLVVE